MYTCLFLYDHLCDNKPCNFSISVVSEQHDYSTRTATSLQLFLPYSRTNIRKFCPTVIGKYFWNDLPFSIRNISSKSFPSNIILLNTNLLDSCHDVRCVCAYVCVCVRVLICVFTYLLLFLILMYGLIVKSYKL